MKEAFYMYLNAYEFNLADEILETLNKNRRTEKTKDARLKHYYDAEFIFLCNIFYKHILNFIKLKNDKFEADTVLNLLHRLSGIYILNTENKLLYDFDYEKKKNCLIPFTEYNNNNTYSITHLHFELVESNIISKTFFELYFSEKLNLIVDVDHSDYKKMEKEFEEIERKFELIYNEQLNDSDFNDIKA